MNQSTFQVDAALARFREGYNCSQATFSAFAETLGLPLDVALQLAAPFGGGIGRQGEVCGAASGALMSIGLRYGSALPDKAAKERTYALAAEFLRRFEAANGAVRCCDLIGFDTSTPEGQAAARERQVFTTVCPHVVASAIEIAGEILARE